MQCSPLELTDNLLKVIAVAAMTLDHLAVVTLRRMYEHEQLEIINQDRNHACTAGVGGAVRIFAANQTVIEQDMEVTAVSEEAESLPMESLLGLIAQINVPVRFVEDSGIFQVDGHAFYSVKVPTGAALLYPKSASMVYPLEWDDTVASLKQYLWNMFGANPFPNVFRSGWMPERTVCSADRDHVFIHR